MFRAGIVCAMTYILTGRSVEHSIDGLLGTLI